jgi:hypothetical protein
MAGKAAALRHEILPHALATTRRSNLSGPLAAAERIGQLHGNHRSRLHDAIGSAYNFNLDGRGVEQSGSSSGS